MMPNSVYLTLAACWLAAVVIAMACARWHVVRDRAALWAITRNVLAERRYALVGVAGALLYGLVYFVLGGRVVYFYERLLFNVTGTGLVIGILSALLIGVMLALFAYNLQVLGLLQSKKGAWGVAGTLFAVVVSFCP